MQFTRDALIVLSGSKEKGRDFVYWTEVKDIPATDLATIERLWNKFSGGKFGYSVQKVRSFLCGGILACRRRGCIGHHHHNSTPKQFNSPKFYFCPHPMEFYFIHNGTALMSYVCSAYGSDQRETLNCFAKRLDGPPRMVKLRERSVGSVPPNSPMM